MVIALTLMMGCFFSPGMIAFAEDEALAYVSFATGDWAAQYWNDGNDYAPIKTKMTKVTGYGQYTVSTDLSAVEGKGFAFLDVEIANGEARFPNSFMQIDAVKINGEAITLTSKTYTSTDDEVITRTNLYNEWVSDITEGRTLNGGLDGATAIPLDHTAFTDTVIKTIEVTFTLKEGMALGTSTAYLSIADTAWSTQYWFDGNNYAPIVAQNVEVTGYGQYTVALDFSEVGSLADVVFMDVEIKNGELNFPYNYMKIDAVKVNGQAIRVGNTYTSSDNDQDTRTNLFNTWVGTVSEGRTNGLEYSQVSATPLEEAALKDIKTIEVTFTMMEGEAPEPAPYEMPSEFNAFMMFSDVSDAWQSYAPGKSGDTKVTGDGTYTVYLKASDIGATGKATKGQVFLIDIEQLGEAMFAIGTLREDPSKKDALVLSDLEVSIRVWIDGKEVEANSAKILTGDLEGNKRLRLEFYNVWGSGTADNPVVMPELLTPQDEIKVEFTLKGTGIKDGKVIGESVEPVTEPTTVAVTEVVEVAAQAESSSNATLIVIAIIAVLAGGAFVFMKKKKA
jgi:LPXTG-motif cell wall-anchored protein